MSRLGVALEWLGGPLRLFGYPWRRQQVTGDLIAPSGMSAADLADEVLAGLFARPGRMSLTVLGTVIGLAALVATLGLSRTAGNRIVGHFDALAATEIVVSRSATSSPEASALPWDAPARLERLNGVAAAGNMSTVDVGGRQISTSPISDPTRQTEFKLSVQAASPGLFAAVRAELRSGRFLDEGNSSRADRVAVLGPSAAQKLAVGGLAPLPAIRIGDDAYLVVGILEGVARPHPQYVYAGMSLQRRLIVDMLRAIRELAGGAFQQLPSSEAGFSSPDTRADFERYFRGATATARERVKLLKLVWDFVGTEFGGRQLQYEMFYSASQPVVNTRMFRAYDWARATAAVDRCLGEYA